MLHHVTGALGTEDVIADIMRRAGLLPAVSKELYAMRVFVHHCMVIEDMAVFRAGANLPAARAGRPDRVLILHRPGHLVQTVDVLLDDVIARKPREVEPVAQ